MSELDPSSPLEGDSPLDDNISPSILSKIKTAYDSIIARRANKRFKTVDVGDVLKKSGVSPKDFHGLFKGSTELPVTPAGERMALHSSTYSKGRKPLDIEGHSYYGMAFGAPSSLPDTPAPSIPEYLSSDNALRLSTADLWGRPFEPWTSPFSGQENRTFAIVDMQGRDHGVVNAEYDPQTGDVHIHGLDTRNLDRGLTHIHAADLLYDLRKSYPQAKSISGMRMTGARGPIRPETKIPWPQETDPGTPGRRASALPAPPPEPARTTPMTAPPVTAPPVTGSPPGGYESPEMAGHIHRMLGPSRLDDPDAQNEKTP